MTNLHTRRRPAHALAAAHCVLGTLLLAQPRAVPRVVLEKRGVPPSWIVRLLGVRTGVQGAAEYLHPRVELLRLGVAVDLIHALSMIAAAGIWPRYRRAALISAGTAVTSAGLGAALTRSL